jgi:hypothetical protein
MADLKLAIYVVLMAVVGYLAIQLLGAAVDIIVAVFGVVGSLVVSVFKYSADRVKEQENEALKIKRANYQKLLEAIGEFTTNVEAKHKLMVVHTESWAFANAGVVEKTGDFLAKPSQDTLKQLLISMRQDIGLPDLTNIEKLVTSLYPEKQAKTGLPSN